MRRACAFVLPNPPDQQAGAPHPPELHAVEVGFQQGGQLRPAVEAHVPSPDRGRNRLATPAAPPGPCSLPAGARRRAGAPGQTPPPPRPGWDSGGKSRCTAAPQTARRQRAGARRPPAPAPPRRPAFPGPPPAYWPTDPALSGRSPETGAPPPAAALPCRSPRPEPSRGESGQAAPATPGTAHGHGCRSGRCHRSMPAGQRLGQSAFYSRSSHILLIEFYSLNFVHSNGNFLPPTRVPALRRRCSVFRLQNPAGIAPEERHPLLQGHRMFPSRPICPWSR